MYNIGNIHVKIERTLKMKHGFIKVAAASPYCTVAGCSANADRIISLVHEADTDGVKLVVFPELYLSGATCGDLFFSDTLLRSAQRELLRTVSETSDTDTIIIIGFPLVVNDKIYNCAAFCQKGQILGIIPKTILNVAESRYFSSYTGSAVSIKLGDDFTVFGNTLVFADMNMPSLKIGIEIGDEAFARVSPSSRLCELGATVIANPFCAPETVGSDKYSELMLSSLSYRNVCGYVHAESGDGESTTDGVYGGALAVYENGKAIAKKASFTEGDMLVTELDIELIAAERRRDIGFTVSSPDTMQQIFFALEEAQTELTRRISPSPFIPECACEVRKVCDKILTIQARGLAQRMEKAHAEKCVIGISGGLDSCLAILVAARAVDILGKPRENIIGVTMPCFGTTQRTRSNAEILCESLGTTFRCVNIGDAVRQHFSDIGHDEANRNVVYENAQARERTQVIMDIANAENALVVGTGDLSELALGWATYNGDHMSMYGVNGGVPKTLIRHIVAFCADRAEADGANELAGALRDILDTPVSPELLPAEEDGSIAQKTEDLVGPYEIHDFYIFYLLRYGFSPDKLYRMAKVAFEGKYSDEVLLKWLKNLVRRFFAQQFKRSCLPDGPRVGTVSVSPRGGLCMPSDASSAEWMAEIE